MNGYKHFGCVVRNPEEAKLTRLNYAPITIATRKNSFHDVGMYSIGQRGKFSTIDEALSAFWENHGNYLVNQYIRELDQYKELLNQIKKSANIAKKCYRKYITFRYKTCIYYKYFLNSCKLIKDDDLSKILYLEEMNLLRKAISYDLENYMELFTKRMGMQIIMPSVEKEFICMKLCNIEDIMNFFCTRNIDFTYQIEILEKYTDYTKEIKYFCLQYIESITSKIINENYSEEAKKLLSEVSDTLEEISLYTVEDMLKSNYLKPNWLYEYSYDSLPDVSEIRKIVRKIYFPYRTDEECEKLQKKALYNFDLNMEFYKRLDRNKFNEEIKNFLFTHPEFVEVTDLNDYKNTTGIYIMVLDEYKQVYIGMTAAKYGIKWRIQVHWNNVKTLDSLVFGGVNESVLSIDSFRHLDTTRIFVCTDIDKNDLYSKEYELIETAFSPEFLTNRITGGDIADEKFAIKPRKLV